MGLTHPRQSGMSDPCIGFVEDHFTLLVSLNTAIKAGFVSGQVTQTHVLTDVDPVMEPNPAFMRAMARCPRSWSQPASMNCATSMLVSS
jgi:hypothetical protein